MIAGRDNFPYDLNYKKFKLLRNMSPQGDFGIAFALTVTLFPVHDRAGAMFKRIRSIDKGVS